MEFSNDDVRVMLLKIEYEIARQKMSKKEFYQRSGISSALYSQWNTGTVKPTMKSIGRAADALGLSVEFLLGEEEKEKSPSEEDELDELLQALRDREDLRAMLAVGRHNTPDQVRKLTALMETMQEG